MTVAQVLLLPAFVHVGLVYALGVRLAVGRFRAARAREVNVREVAFDSTKWPRPLRQIGSSYENQFELPVFYYAALALMLATGLADWLAVVLSWAFVATRILHSYIHVGSNVLVFRFGAFISGAFFLMLMWLWFGLRLFVIG